jgi:hypothetical protein
MLIKQSETTAARRTIYFTAVNTADDSAYTSALAGADIRISKAGGSEADSLGTATHIATGLFKYVFDTTEVDTVGEVSVRLAKSGVYNDVRVVNVVAFDPYAVAGLGLTNLDATVSSRVAAADYEAIDDWLDSADSVETGLTLRGFFRLAGAVLFGKSAGAGSGTETFRSAVADGKVRVTSTISSNNRTAVTTDTDA